MELTRSGLAAWLTKAIGRAANIDLKGPAGERMARGLRPMREQADVMNLEEASLWLGEAIRLFETEDELGPDRAALVEVLTQAVMATDPMALAGLGGADHDAEAVEAAPAPAPVVAAPAPAPVVAAPAPAPVIAAPAPQPEEAIEGLTLWEEAAPAPMEEEAPIYIASAPEDELFLSFLNEVREHLGSSEAALLALESNPSDAEAVNSVFRAFHTIKSAAAFFGLDPAAELAHKAESLLSRVRDGEVRFTREHATLSLRSVDMLNTLIQLVAAPGEGQRRVPDAFSPLLRDLAHADKVIAAGGHEAVHDVPEPVALVTKPAAPSAPAPQGAVSAGPAVIPGDDVARVVPPKPAPSIAPVAPGVPVERRSGGDRRASAQDKADGEGGNKKALDSRDPFVRVRTDRLDLLIDMVGELVIAQSMVSQDKEFTSGRFDTLGTKVSQAGRIVRDLQQLSLSLRMVPVKGVFQKLARVARDIAVRTKKDVQFVAEGEDTEIDRNLVEILGDPLMHMIRNACDHGIEPPDEREAAGKPREGRVVVAASHEGGSIVIRMSDDGRGLNKEKILAKALERGVIQSAAGMADSEVWALIFEAGFSTADAVTDISGRGVGMDTVRQAIEALRGRIEIQSVAGKGTTFSVMLPLTLAVTDGMLLRVGTERFIIPTVQIRRTFRPTRKDMLSFVGKGEAVQIRGESIPLIRLHHLFSLPGAVEDPTEALVIVVQEGEHRGAVLVDELLGQQQFVAKSLGGHLGTVEGVASAAILGDGSVGLILDTMGLCSLARSSTPPHRGWRESLSAPALPADV